jgi:hypothetical protein
LASVIGKNALPNEPVPPVIKIVESFNIGLAPVRIASIAARLYHFAPSACSRYTSRGVAPILSAPSEGQPAAKTNAPSRVSNPDSSTDNLMSPELLEYLCEPVTKAPLTLRDATYGEDGSIQAGSRGGAIRCGDVPEMPGETKLGR